MVCKSGIFKTFVDILTNVGELLSRPNALLGFIVLRTFCLIAKDGLIVTITLFSFKNT